MPNISAALRVRVRERAGRRCEYCLVPEIVALLRHEIDHIVALKHGGQTTAENLALCCTLCNKHKGSDIAAIDSDTRNAAVVSSAPDRWRDHFEMRGGEIVSHSTVGRATVRLLRLNQRLTE